MAGAGHPETKFRRASIMLGTGGTGSSHNAGESNAYRDRVRSISGPMDGDWDGDGADSTNAGGDGGADLSPGRSPIVRPSAGVPGSPQAGAGTVLASLHMKTG